MSAIAPLSPADRLNRECFCIGTDVAALHDWLDTDLARGGLTRSLNESHPHLFSSLPVFVSRSHVLEMQEVIRAVHAVVGTDAYRGEALDARTEHRGTSTRRLTVCCKATISISAPPGRS